MNVIKAEVCYRDGRTDRACLSESETNGVRVFGIDHLGKKALNSLRAVDITVGVESKQFNANYRNTEIWCKPAFADKVPDIPEKTLCLLYKTPSGYGCIMTVCCGDYVGYIRGGCDGFLHIELASHFEEAVDINDVCFLHAEGSDVFELVKRCVKAGAELAGIPTREGREYPEMFEYLGWCSWDAFMTSVSEQNLIEKCEEFRQKGIPVKWAIIDDMWGDVPGLERSENVPRKEMFKIMHSSRLNSFKADSRRFPDGLSHCIERIKEYGISVGMWHPTTGYWKGIVQDGELMQKMPEVFIKTRRLRESTLINREGDYIVHSPEYDKAHKYYDTAHRYFESCGADFVKIDFQSFTHLLYGNVLPLGQCAKNIHRAIEKSVAEHFGGKIINCMGMSAENVWSRPYTAISRCSNDFQPEDRDWFTQHILQCAYNCILHGEIYYCDWDMWWTDDSQGIKNSVLRAISGGPIYVSDTLHRSRKDVLMPLCYSDGKILRADLPARPIERCIFINPETQKAPLTLWNRVSDGAVMASFNINGDNKAVDGYISSADIPNLEGESFIVYDYFEKHAHILLKDEKMRIEFANRDEFSLWTVVPKTDKVTFLGLADKMLSYRAIEKVCKNRATLHCGGDIIAASESAVKTVKVNGQSIPFTQSGILISAHFDSDTPIDVEII